MEKISINVIKGLEKGVINLFKTDKEEEYVLVIIHKGGEKILPVLNKSVYVSDEDEKAETLFGNIVEEIIKSKSFQELKGFSVRFKKAPEPLSRTIAGSVPAPGARVAREAKKALAKAGYELPLEGSSIRPSGRDCSALLASNSEAKENLQAMMTKLDKIGATYSSLAPEVKVAFEGALAGTEGGLILMGPTGTGKSMACELFAVHNKMPLLRYQVNGGTSVESLVGGFIPNDGDEGGKYKFAPGPLLRAYAEELWGCPIVLDEINYGSPAVNAVINQFSDGTSPTLEINGKVYHRSPNFMIFMTMNPGYRETEPLNVALKNRFGKVNVCRLPAETFVSRMISYSRSLGHVLKKGFWEALYKFSNFIEQLGKDGGYHEDVVFSIRNAQRFCDYILLKPRTAEEFAEGIFVQYVNDLTCDNDNSYKVEQLKSDETVRSKIRDLFAQYDFAQIPEVEGAFDLDEIVSIKVVDKEEEEGVGECLLSDSDISDLLEGV